jgi:hypothetical protein
MFTKSLSHYSGCTHPSLYYFICQVCRKASVLEDTGALSHGFFHLSTPFLSHRLVRAAKKLGFFLGEGYRSFSEKNSVFSSSVFTTP